LYVTSSFLCFRSHVGSQRVQIAISKLKTIERKKLKIKVVLVSEERYTFKGVRDRDNCFNAIVNRANAIGNTKLQETVEGTKQPISPRSNRVSQQIKQDEKCVLS